MTEHFKDLVSQLRSLRIDAQKLRDTLVDDLCPFQKPDDRSFRTLPQSSGKGISVATSCTALMALVDSNKLNAMLSEKPCMPNGAAQASQPAPGTAPPAETKPPTPAQLFSAVVADSWKSSELDDLNAFTTCMVIRAAGFVAEAK